MKGYGLSVKRAEVGVWGVEFRVYIQECRV